MLLLLLLLVHASAGSAPNMRPNLVPPQGMWRGATLDQRGYPNTWFDGAFEMDYHRPLHIFRTFKTRNFRTISWSEKSFVSKGGILFYSIQPKPWSDWSPSNNATVDAAIAKFAAEIKKVAPAKIMVAPGYEPDGHAAESQNKTKELYGKAAEYKSMYKNFRRVFQQEGVTNAVFVLDLSNNIKDHFSVLDQLYAGDEAVDWIFFNIFQSSPIRTTSDKGNCSEMAPEIYTQLEKSDKYGSKPWGVGAWGSMNATFGDPGHGYPSKLLPIADRKACISGMAELFEDRAKYGNLKAAIYFNSLHSLLSPRGKVPFSYPELAPTLGAMLNSSVFTVNDAN